MSELGQLLRKARLEQKISLDELQETTKIRKRYLEAIEDGNFKVLPGSFYVRAFIKSYAEAVGLDPGEVMKFYKTDLPPVEPEPVTKPLKRTRPQTRNADRISRWVSSLVMVSFVLLILGVLYFYFYNNAKSRPDTANKSVNPGGRITDSTPPAPVTPAADSGGTTTSSAVYGKQDAVVQPQQTQSQQTQSPPNQPVTDTAAQDVKFVKYDADHNTDFYTVTGAQKLDIQLKVTAADCWYQIDSVTDGKHKLLKSEQKSTGFSNTWSLDSSAWLNIGKANAVELTVNGKVLPVGDGPNPKKIQLDLLKS